VVTTKLTTVNNKYIHKEPKITLRQTGRLGGSMWRRVVSADDWCEVTAAAAAAEQGACAAANTEHTVLLMLVWRTRAVSQSPYVGASSSLNTSHRIRSRVCLNHYKSVNSPSEVECRWCVVGGLQYRTRRCRWLRAAFWRSSVAALAPLFPTNS